MDTAFTDIHLVKGRHSDGEKTEKTGNIMLQKETNNGTEKRIVSDTEEFGEILPLGTDVLKGRTPYKIVKRIFDIILSVLGLVVLSPLMLVVAVAIYVDDPHAASIFVQERVGKNGNRFKVYKFRSMVHNAEELKKELEAQGITMKEEGDPTYKLENDPRVTRVGVIIRKTSIDELPQLVNVIKGEMSIVGPRPLVVSEVEKFDEFSMQRHLVRPGLTCYWQSTKDHNRIPFDDWMKMDIKYIQNCNVWEDIKIIFKTFKVVFTANNN